MIVFASDHDCNMSDEQHRAWIGARLSLAAVSEADVRMAMGGSANGAQVLHVARQGSSYVLLYQFGRGC